MTRQFARKRFGQHFLERAWVEKLMLVIAPGDRDTFVEIGPGGGALTRPLARAAALVLAFEIDRDLASALAAAAPSNLVVIQGDFLEITPERIRKALEDRRLSNPGRIPLRVAGNLPYNVASPILFKLIELVRAGVHIEDVTVMLQREVADRLLAPPGSRDYGVLSVLVRHAAHVQRLLTLPPGAFRPAPKVESAVVRLTIHGDEPPARNRDAFQALVQSVFTRRRKTLANALLAYRPAGKTAIHDALERSRIDGRCRPESLEIAEFVRLSDAFEDAA